MTWFVKLASSFFSSLVAVFWDDSRSFWDDTYVTWDDITTDNHGWYTENDTDWKNEL